MRDPDGQVYRGGGWMRGRGLHPSTFRLNLSAFCGTRGAEGVLRGDLVLVEGVLLACRGCFEYQRWLRSS